MAGGLDHDQFVAAAMAFGMDEFEAEEAWGDWFLTYPDSDKDRWARVPGTGTRYAIARSDQLHILGNGVVPQQAAYALSLLMESHMTK